MFLEQKVSYRLIAARPPVPAVGIEPTTTRLRVLRSTD